MDGTGDVGSSSVGALFVGITGFLGIPSFRPLAVCSTRREREGRSAGCADGRALAGGSLRRSVGRWSGRTVTGKASIGAVSTFVGPELARLISSAIPAVAVTSKVPAKFGDSGALWRPRDFALCFPGPIYMGQIPTFPKWTFGHARGRKNFPRNLSITLAVEQLWGDYRYVPLNAPGGFSPEGSDVTRNLRSE